MDRQTEQSVALYVLSDFMIENDSEELTVFQ
jgi:hypothetical protein